MLQARAMAIRQLLDTAIPVVVPLWAATLSPPIRLEAQLDQGLVGQATWQALSRPAIHQHPLPLHLAPPIVTADPVGSNPLLAMGLDLPILGPLPRVHLLQHLEHPLRLKQFLVSRSHPIKTSIR